jgi:hypothetical protein
VRLVRVPREPPERAFELKFGSGYTQGLGNVEPGKTITSVSGAGIGASVDFDYRATPTVSGGLEVQYQEFVNQNNSGSRGLALNVGVTYHGSPHKNADPWIRLGTGYRMLWDVHPDSAPNTTNLYHGFDIATLKVGYDLRAGGDVAVSPVIGADLQTFDWRDGDLLNSTSVGTFIYAGIQGRFDTTSHPTSKVVAVPVR